MEKRRRGKCAGAQRSRNGPEVSSVDVNQAVRYPVTPPEEQAPALPPTFPLFTARKVQHVDRDSSSMLVLSVLLRTGMANLQLQ